MINNRSETFTTLKALNARLKTIKKNSLCGNIQRARVL
jgi:hypothetical protein